MPWNQNRYPQSMKNLAPKTRAKAIEIANALLEEGMEEGRAIAIATSKAEEWAEASRLACQGRPKEGTE